MYLLPSTYIKIKLILFRIFYLKQIVNVGYILCAKINK